MILQGILVILICCIIPLVLGWGWNRRFRLLQVSMTADLAFSMVIGHLIMWSAYQLIAVPGIMIHTSFTATVIGWGILLVLLGILVYLTPGSKGKLEQRSADAKKESGYTAVVFWAVAIGIILLQCSMYVLYAHTDTDDSRFLANAVEAYENNTLFRLHPITGETVDYLIGDRAKDVVSPWSLYLALIARITGIHPATVAHTVYAPILLLLSYLIYYVISRLLFAKEENASIFFLSITMLNLLYSGTSRLQSVFSLTRIWQGKAIVASLTIPAYFCVYLLFLKERKIQNTFGKWTLILLLTCSACLFSGIGVITAGILSVVFGLLYLCNSKSLREIPYFLISLIPAGVYGFLYLWIR